MTWALVVLPTLLFLFGFPIFVVLAASAAMFLMFFSSAPLTTLHQVMFGSVDSIALLSVPLFIFAGELMGAGAISTRTLAWMYSIFGRAPASTGLATVGVATVLGVVGGSSAAATATTGRLLLEELRKNGYGDRFNAGLITSCGTIAIVIPPSINMILYGVVAEVSIPAVFAAGMLPGVLISLVMCAYVVWYGVKHGLREGEPFSWARFFAATRASFWALGMQVLVLGGLFFGIFTATESAAIACVYAIFVSRWVYNDVSWSRIVDLAGDSMYLTAQVMVLFAAAGVYSWMLTVSGIPAASVQVLEWIKADPWVVLLAINVFLLIVGTAIDPVSATLVLTPLLLPIVKAIGVDPVHFGVIMTINMAIGNFTPPFGLNIFVAQAQFKMPVKTIYMGTLPFFWVQTACLMVVSYWPWLSMYPVKLMYGR